MVAVELGARGIFAFKVGPRILLYGTESYRNHYEEKEKQAVENWRQKYYSKEKRTVELHYADQDSGYAKFFPHEKKLEQDLVTGETFEVRINGAGFRGPDFATKKSTDVRVLTLGSSSTFGFYDRDTETYPYLMKKVLERQCPKYSFEVINFGIPHLTSHQILALFRSEGLPLKPDVITFYEGNNDSLIAPAPEEQSRGAAFYAGLRERLLIVNLADHLLSAKASSQLRGFDPEYSRQRTQVFLENLDAIRVLAERNGIKMVAATQQRRADFEGRERAKGVTYKQEVAELRGRLAEQGGLARNPLSMLIHEQMMDELRGWAKDKGVPLVDIIALLDDRRDLLLSWVHLHPEANARIAEALAKPILKLFCSETAGI